jgi:ATP-dependent RNA helicase DDX27
VQAARLEALEQFRTGEARFLLATDVAARGLDILGVETVVNFDCPASLETYLHRVGRTARAGASGSAITFVEDGDRIVLKALVKQIQAKLASRVVPKDVLELWRAKVEALQPQVDEIVKVWMSEQSWHVVRSPVSTLP